MFKAFDFCIPTRGTRVPAGPDWLHEIKYDGYRLRVERGGDRVRLITRNGYDWTKRYPWIVESALKNRVKQFVIDGEAVILGVDGVPDFNALHSRKHDHEVQFYAFDVMALAGEDSARPSLEPAEDQLGRASSPGVPTASLSRHSNKARSVLIYSAPPATWDLKAWCRSGAIARIAAAVR
jgi:bifunctional non-homologous end joining protein LigD